jgi:hypothetical protein
VGTFKSLSDLAKHLEKNQIKKALETEVKKVAERTLKENVITEVYDAYDSEYQRTGGLLQDSNIESKMESDDTLSVRSIREENGRDIASIIETGKGYSYHGLDERIGERPFHAITAMELEYDGLAKKALKDGLKKQGIDVE